MLGKGLPPDDVSVSSYPLPLQRPWKFPFSLLCAYVKLLQIAPLTIAMFCNLQSELIRSLNNLVRSRGQGPLAEVCSSHTGGKGRRGTNSFSPQPPNSSCISRHIPSFPPHTFFSPLGSPPCGLCAVSHVRVQILQSTAGSGKLGPQACQQTRCEEVEA